MTAAPPIRLRLLGTVPYTEALTHMRQWTAARQAAHPLGSPARGPLRSSSSNAGGTGNGTAPSPAAIRPATPQPASASPSRPIPITQAPSHTARADAQAHTPGTSLPAAPLPATGNPLVAGSQPTTGEQPTASHTADCPPPADHGTRRPRSPAPDALPRTAPCALPAAATTTGAPAAPTQGKAVLHLAASDGRPTGTRPAASNPSASTRPAASQPARTQPPAPAGQPAAKTGDSARRPALCLTLPDLSEAATAGDEIWLMQHPPVFTLGMNSQPEHLLTPGDIPVVPTERGGQITYHGPGQIMAYLMLDLRARKIGVRVLVERIESAIIECLAQYGITAIRQEGAPGIYVQPRQPVQQPRQAGMGPRGTVHAISPRHARPASGVAKIASIGLKTSHGFCYHGLALNAQMDLSPFLRINPCGFQNLQMTDIHHESASPADIDLDTLALNLGNALIHAIEG